MKKIVGIFIALCMSIVLIGCDEVIESSSYDVEGYTLNDNEDIAMTIVEGTIRSTGLSVEFHYEGKHTGIYGDWFTLFVYQDNEWVRLSYIVDSNVGFNAIAYDALDKPTHAIDWEWLYGELPKGRYLIIKTFLDFIESGNYTEYYLASEFTIE